MSTVAQLICSARALQISAPDLVATLRRASLPVANYPMGPDAVPLDIEAEPFACPPAELLRNKNAPELTVVHKTVAEPL
jgi:hypothetical protein